jgi:hypothetical protein
MDQWRAYLDESYDSKTFCVGGFLARVAEWEKIERAWAKVIAGEGIRSQRKGFAPISAYHATDCANLKNEFSVANGWDINRQIRITKRLISVIGSHRLAGFVIGGSIADVQNHLEPGKDVPKDFLYSICFKTCLIQIAGWLSATAIDPQVSVFYERSDFDKLAREAFEMMRTDTNRVYQSIISAEPKGWEDCIPLQSADLMAYEGFKAVGSSLKGKSNVRKSLEAIVGSQNEIVIAHFQEQNFADIMRMIENGKEGRPLAEGIASALRECEGNVPFVPRYE